MRFSLFQVSGSSGRKLASVFDPLINSGIIFLVQSAVLLTTSKHEFATYSLTYSYVVMGQSMLTGLFGGPLVTLLGELSNDRIRSRVGEGLLRLQLLSALASGLAGTAVAVWLGVSLALASTAALAFLALSFRDALRGVLASQLRLGEAVAVATRFAVVGAACVVVTLLAVRRVDALIGLGIIATSAVTTVAFRLGRALKTDARPGAVEFQRLLSMAAWSLPGVAVIWLQNSFYLTLVALNLSLGAVGEISAARMTVMPLLIVASGLLRLTQVEASRKLANNALSDAIAGARRLALMCLAAGAIITGACWLTSITVDSRWIPASYPHLLTLAGAWCAFAAATTARGFYSSLLQAMGDYRQIFLLNSIILPFVLVGVSFAPRTLGVVGAVLPMVAGELLLLLMLGWHAGRKANTSPREC